MWQILLTIAAASPIPICCPPPQQPAVTAPAPRLSAAHIEGEYLYLVDITTVFVPVRVKVQVKEGCTTREKVITEYRPVHDMRTSRYPLAEVKVCGRDGKLREAKGIGDRLKERSPVVVSTDGNPVAPFYLRAIREETLILVLTPKSSGPETTEPARMLAPGKGK